jgi:hypothetical protein
VEINVSDPFTLGLVTSKSKGLASFPTVQSTVSGK